jgi:hypothetical protein
MDIVIGIIVLLLIFSPFAAIIYFAITYQRKMFTKAWVNVQDLFTKYQIRLQTQIPQKTSVLLQLQGEGKEGKFHVFNVVIGSGKSRQIITKITVQLTKKLPDFEFYRENIFTKIGETFGIKDVKTGDAEFDKVYRIYINEMYKDKIFSNEMITYFLSMRKDLVGRINCKNNMIEVQYYGVPGFKNATRQFTALFDAAMKILSVKMPNAGHSPGATI